jgi:hypothetical protein
MLDTCATYKQHIRLVRCRIYVSHIYHTCGLFGSYTTHICDTMIRGTQGVPAQIVRTFSFTRSIPLNVKATLPQCTDTQSAFILSLTADKHKIKCACKISDEATTLGRPVYRHLHPSHYVALHGVCQSVDKTAVVYYIDRIVVRGEIFHSANYCHKLKRNSFIVQTTGGLYFEIDTFLVNDLKGQEQCFAIGHYLNVVPYNLCSKLKLSHVIAVAKSRDVLAAVAVGDIIQKCLYISMAHLPVDFVCIQVNSLERCT